MNVIVRIYVKVYREKVKIPYEKPFIILKGVGKRKTQIIWDDHESLAASPTFASFADNVVVKCMSFVVSYLLIHLKTLISISDIDRVNYN